MLARDLLSRGHEVHLFCREVETDPPDGLVVHRMPWMPLGAGTARLVFSAWARREVQRVERRDGPFDVTQAFGRTIGQDVYRVGGGCHETYLEHAHGLHHPLWLRRVLKGAPLQRVKRHLEERMLRGLPRPHVITNSEMSRDDLRHRYDLPDDHLHVVRNGIDLERFRPPQPGEREAVRRVWGVGDDDPVVLFLGNGFSRKGLEVCLRALTVLRELRPDVRLVVGGHDRRAARWQRLARRLDVTTSVVWLGAQVEPEACYRGADVYTLPTAYDPAANSTLEALASGLPVVTTPMNGAAEILQDGRHGTIIPTPVAPDELAHALLGWLETPDREAVRKRARTLAEHYPADISCLSTLDVYRAVLEDRRHASGAPTT